MLQKLGITIKLHFFKKDRKESTIRSYLFPILWIMNHPRLLRAWSNLLRSTLLYCFASGLVQSRRSQQPNRVIEDALTGLIPPARVKVGMRLRTRRIFPKVKKKRKGREARTRESRLTVKCFPDRSLAKVKIPILLRPKQIESAGLLLCLEPIRLKIRSTYLSLKETERPCRKKEYLQGPRIIRNYISRWIGFMFS